MLPSKFQTTKPAVPDKCTSTPWQIIGRLRTHVRQASCSVSRMMSAPGVRNLTNILKDPPPQEDPESSPLQLFVNLSQCQLGPGVGPEIPGRDPEGPEIMREKYRPHIFMNKV